MGSFRWSGLALVLTVFLSSCPAGGGKDQFFLPPAAAALSSSGGEVCPASPWPFSAGAYLADTVTEAPGQGGAFGNPLCAVNGVYGAGSGGGSLDVYSLRSSTASTMCKANEKCIVLEWAGLRVRNETGTDFVVFENPFNRTGGGRFIEAVIVEVSENGTAWCGWNPAYTGETDSNQPQFSGDIYNPSKYLRLAGIQPVLFYQSTWTDTAADVFDVTKAGGDHFDLGDANFGQSGDNCDAAAKNAMQTNGFIYMRLITANSRNPANFPLPGDSFDKTADIDGVVAKGVDSR
jgi:hypothetical protein